MNSELNNPKICIWDIEVTPMTVTTWGLWKQNIPYYAIQREASIICISWKILGEKKVHYASILQNGKKNFLDDYKVVKRFREALNDIDILVAHNGDRFDLRWLNAKLAEHDLDPIPKLLTIDTLKESRKVWRLPSYKLDYLVRKFGLDAKISTDPSLWQRVMDGEKSAVREMVEYCNHDVEVLEKLYLKMRPYMKSHPNIADINTHNCPRCNSDNYIKAKTRRNASGILRQQFQCKDCGSYFTPRASEKEKPLTRHT